MRREVSIFSSKAIEYFHITLSFDFGRYMFRICKNCSVHNWSNWIKDAVNRRLGHDIQNVHKHIRQTAGTGALSLP